MIHPNSIRVLLNLFQLLNSVGCKIKTLKQVQGDDGV